MPTESMNQDEKSPFSFPEGGVNIGSAVALLERAEAGDADRDEINEMLGTLRELQDEGETDPIIQVAIVRLTAARDKK